MSLAETEHLAPPSAPDAVLPVASIGTAPSSHAPAAIWDGRALVCTCLLADALVLLAAVAIVLLGAPAVPAAPPYELLVLPPVASILLVSRHTYVWGIGTSPLDTAWRAAGAVVTAAMVVVVIAAALGTSPDVAAAATAAALGTAGMLGTRALLTTGRRRALLRADGGQPAVVVGSGTVGQRIVRRLLSDPTYGLRPVGFVDAPYAPGDPDHDAPHPPASMLDYPTPERPLPVLGTIADLRSVAAATGARHVIIAFSGSARDNQLGPLLRDCEQLGLDVSVVPRLFDAINSDLVYQHVGGLPLMGLRPSSRNRVRLRVKRTIDILGALGALVASAPLLALIALAVRLESPGPVLFRQRRLGRDGQVFDVLKFRSMRGGPAVDFVPSAGSAPGGVEGIDRRTRLGRFLRRSSLDELPQLINILRGEMSLVGPRPERPEFAVAFARDIHRYDDRLRVRSGLTGWAQVHGYRGQTSIEDRVEWDNYYIEHWSLGLDLKIVLMTVVALFRPSES